MSYKILSVRGHIEVYTRQGAFLFSADSAAEARSILEDMT